MTRTTAIVGASGLAVALLFTVSTQAIPSPPDGADDVEFDVLVVGAGQAGLGVGF